MPSRPRLFRLLTCLVAVAVALGTVALPAGAATTLPTPRVPWNRSMDCQHADATVYRCATNPTVYDTTPAFHAYSDQATHQALDFRFEVWPGHQANPTGREVDVVVANRPSRTYVDFTDTTVLPAGDHQWRVQACLHSQPRNCSQFSTFLPFVVDTRNPFTIAPSSPFNRGVLCVTPLEPGPRCAVDPSLRDTTPTLTATATQARNQHVDLHFEVYASHDATPTTRESTGTASDVPAPQAATVTVETALADGEHEWRVQACLTALPENCSAWSTYLPFVVDTTAPGVPVLTPSTPADTDAGTTSATVGRTVESITLAPAAADDGVIGYSYSLAPGAEPGDTTAHCLPTPSLDTVCPAHPDQPVTISFSPQAPTWTLTVYAFDAAGNTGGSSVVFYAAADQVLRDGHAWTPATATGACNQTPVSDTANRTGTTPATPLTTYSASTCAKPGVTLESGDAGTAWSFAGNGYVRTSAPSVDTSASFSVGATVQTRPTLSTTAETVLSQDATAQSGFILGRSGTQWRFCMPRSDQARATYDCAIGGTVLPGGWTRLAGVWDAANHELRLYVGSSLIATTAHDSSPKTTYGFLVGADKVNQRGEYFSGYAYRAFAVPGTPTSTQLGFLEAGTFFAG